ncbi:uncharacterized protein UTRI_00068 [Ustilago trichophora]|uniref:Uncharacterized protein n=1 Tax=Ustilago trichophora TaxID=86804 RepID=A0A5C3DQZ9_9BASI|nr:uncharacterized protein UTRI_00068 [Ustilago trichophora]
MPASKKSKERKKSNLSFPRHCTKISRHAAVRLWIKSTRTRHKPGKQAAIAVLYDAHSVPGCYGFMTPRPPGSCNLGPPNKQLSARSLTDSRIACWKASMGRDDAKECVLGAQRLGSDGLS